MKNRRNRETQLSRMAYRLSIHNIKSPLHHWLVMGYIETVMYKRPSETQNTYLEVYNKHIMNVFVILFVTLISLCTVYCNY